MEGRKGKREKGGREKEIERERWKGERDRNVEGRKRKREKSVEIKKFMT